MSYVFYIKKNKGFRVFYNGKSIFSYPKNEPININDNDVHVLKSFGWRALTLLELAFKIGIDEKFINLSYSYKKDSTDFRIRIEYQNELIRETLHAAYYVNGSKIYLRSANNPELCFLSLNSIELFVRGYDYFYDKKEIFTTVNSDRSKILIDHINFLNNATICDILLLDLSARI